MTYRCRPAWAKLALIAGFASLVGTTSVKAQAWADNNYAFRRPLTFTNSTPQSIATGDIIAYAFAPQTGALAKSRSDGKDVKVVYFNGTTNVAVPQTSLDMGVGNAKILFEAQAPIAPPPFPVSENASAGNTGYASLPAGAIVTPLATEVNGDDGGTTVTLPFSFPFGATSSNQMYFSVDGYLVPGTAKPMSQYGRGNTGKPGIYPFTSDYTISSTGGPAGANLFFYADATQAIFRWEVAESGQSTVIAKFAAIVKPDGSVRFVYSDTVQPPSAGVGGPGSYGELCYGLMADGSGNGIVHFPTDTYPTSADLSNHADILYNQAFGGVNSTGYWVYYGNTLDDGIAGRVAPAASKVVKYDFDDGTAQGWTKVSGNADTVLVEPITWNTAKCLHMQASSGGHPAAWAAGQTNVLGDATVYAKIGCANSDEIGVGSRCDDSGAGYFNALDAYGSQELIVERTTPGGTNDYKIISNGVPFTSALWTYDVMKVTGTGADIAIKGRAWVDGVNDPGTWIVSGVPSDASARFDTGALGVTGWSGDKYIDWICATGPNAELTTSSLGAEALNPTIGIIQGTVTERWSHQQKAGATVTLIDSNGLYVTSVLTNAAGQYTLTFATFGTISVGVTSGNSLSARASLTVAGGSVTTQDLVLDIQQNGDFEIPNADNSLPLGWGRDAWNTNAAKDHYVYANDQNHTPGGHWSFKLTNLNAQTSGTPDSLFPIGGLDYDNPLIPGDVTLGMWVRSDTTDLGVRLRTRTPNWQGVGANGDGTANGNGQWRHFKATPVNTDDLPLNTWSHITTTSNYDATKPLSGLRFGVYAGYYGATPIAGNVWLDDITVTVTPKYMVIAQVNDDLGQPVAYPWLGQMRYGGTLFSNPQPGPANGKAYFYSGTPDAFTLAAWKGPLSSAPANISANGALVGTVSTTPVAYDANLTGATATIVVNTKAVNILSTANGTTALLNGTSQWPAYVIDKRIDKTGLTDPGDSTNPADWVQVARNPGNVSSGKLWDANIDYQYNGWGSGGMRGILSKDGSTDIPTRYRTATVDIDLGASWPIDQLEFGYFFYAEKHRVWVSDTPFQWNVELPDSAAVINTTTDTTPVYGQGFTSANKPYAGPDLSSYQIYRLTTPAKGRYLRVRQDGAPYGDGHQILLEMRAMSLAATPQPVHGRVVDATGTPIQGAFVGPFPASGPGNYVKTDATGHFTWYGPGIPTQLSVHVEAKKTDNTYDPTPYLLAGPFSLTPAVGGTEMGDIYVNRSNGNAMVGATDVVIANEGAPGTEAYGATFCDPSEATHPVSLISDQLAGDTHQWAARPSVDAAGNPCVGDVSTGATYLRVGVESTLAAPADLDEIDIYWFQNGFPAGFYVQTSSDGGSNWSTVYTTTNYAGNYNDGYPGDGLRVTPVKFATKTGVNKIRVIFSSKSGRNTPENEFIINEIVALKHAVIPITTTDVMNALRVAAGLNAGPLTSDAQFSVLNADNTAGSAGKIDVVDAIALAKKVVR